MVETKVQPSRPGGGGQRRWGLWLVGLVVVLALLAFLVPVGLSVGRALADLVVEYQLVVVGLGLFAVITVLRIVNAYVRRLEASAKTAEMVNLQSGQPVHIIDVSTIGRRTAERMLDRHYDVELMRASGGQLGNQPPPPVYIQQTAPALAEPAAAGVWDFKPGAPVLQQLHDRGLFRLDQRELLVAMTEERPIYLPLATAGFVAVAGMPRMGKTALVRLIAAQFAMAGWHLAIGDPHIEKADGLINTTKPISGSFIKQAVTPAEIAAMIRFVDRIGRRRVEGDADRTPVLMILDEFTQLVLRGQLPDDVLAILPAMAVEYAGVAVYGMVMGQDWAKGQLGGERGAALRRSMLHRLLLRLDEQNGRYLLPSASMAAEVAQLQQGELIYFGSDSPIKARFPRLLHDDMIFASGGRPMKPYQPRQLTVNQSAAPGPGQSTATVAPTQPVNNLPPVQSTVSQPAAPAAVAPTAPMAEPAPPTVQELIFGYLRAHAGWFTSTELAAELGQDLKVVRTELTPMVRARTIQRRKCMRQGVRETYEYSRA